MKYCECGKKNDFTAKFCSNCGHSFVSLAGVSSSKPEIKPSPTPSPPQPARKQPTLRTPSFLNKAKSSQDNDDDDDEQEAEIDINLINSLSGLEVEITPTKPQTSTVGGLMETGSEKSAEKLLNSNKGPVKVNKKKILEEIRREGSSIRNG